MNLNPRAILAETPPPKPDPQPTPKQTTKADYSAADDAEEIARLGRIVVPDLDADAGDDPTAPHDLDEAPQAAPDQITPEAFHEVFCMCFNMPGVFLPPLKPLAIQPGEEEPARAASQAVHRLLEIYYPAALKPGSETFALLAQAAPFLVVKVMAARSIVAALKAPQEPQERREAREDRARPDRQASNTNAPPSGRASGPMSWMDAEAAAA